MSDKVVVAEFPRCNFAEPSALGQRTPCRDDGEAHYDGKTILGPWANMCEQHFDEYGVGLGTGRGQKLILRDSHTCILCGKRFTVGDRVGTTQPYSRCHVGFRGRHQAR